MVEQRLDATFAALADPTRRGMLASLAKGEASVGELAAPYAMSLAGASKHLGVLERAVLVERRRVGRQHLCRLNPERLAEADRWLKHWERFWSVSLDRLAGMMAGEKAARAEERETGGSGGRRSGGDGGHH